MKLPKKEMEQAQELFAYILEEHLKGERSLTTLKIAVHDGRLKILELVQQC